MSLVTLGRDDFLGSCPWLYYKAVFGLSGLAQPALTGQRLLIIWITVLQKISPAANGYVPNPVGDRSIFCDIHHSQIQHFQKTLIRRKYRL